MLEHQHRRAEQRQRVREISADPIRGGVVHGLENGDRRPVARRARRRDAAGETGAEIGDQVAVKALHHQHVEPIRVEHELHAGRIDDQLLQRDAGMASRDLAHALQEKTVRHLQDVRFMDRRDLLPARARSERERELGDARAPGLGHDLDALDDSRNDAMLEPGVFAFHRLANDHEIEPRIATAG